jgi:hypothetical protein
LGFDALRVAFPGGGAVGPVSVEVLTYAPTVFYHCQHCEVAFQRAGVGDRVHREQARESLPDDLRAEYEELSDWVHDLAHRYHGRVRFKVVDAASIEGFYKSLRYRVRRYPAFVIDRKDRFVGTEFAQVEDALSRRLAAP